MMPLANRTAIVTGAGRGIGRAIALRLARDGANVVVNDISAEASRAVCAEVQELGRHSLAIVADVSNGHEVQAMVRDTIAEFGSLEMMIANAGICRAARMQDLTEVEWDATLATNAKGVFLCDQAAAAQMIEQGQGGRIINCSSIAGRQGYPHIVHYCASKFAVIGITQSLALELAPYGITVNAYCPGIVETPLWETLDAAYAGIPGAKTMAEQIRGIPLGRAQTPDDVAALVSFLASEDSDYITGQSLISDGGIVMR
jgi:meso-butanediol dehydrogenase/(S,S)-butanediol dehydrogenase/diacetyl reductase